MPSGGLSLLLPLPQHPLPPRPPPSYEILFSNPLPQRWVEDGPAVWPLRAADSQGHKARLQEKGAGGCTPPRMLSGSARCVEKDVGTTAGTFPYARGLPPKPTRGFSLWEPEISLTTECARFEMSGN